MHLSSNRSQMKSKCGKNKKVAHEAIAEWVTDVLTTFWRPLWSITGQMHRNMESIWNKLCSRKSCFISGKARESGAFPILPNTKKAMTPSIIYAKWSNPIGCYALAKNCDWFRQITPLSNLTWVRLLVEWKLTAKKELNLEIYNS